ncbi:MAG: hypothetical protein AB1631_23885 [Acidobacteriota bacterium]
MKNCPMCDLDFEDEFIFCAEDGSRLEYLVEFQRKDSISKQIDSPPIKPATVTALYCPACQGEYPLTFTVCPIDGLRLTREKFSAPKKKEPPAVEPAVIGPATVKQIIVKPTMVEQPIAEPTIVKPPIVESTLRIDLQPRDDRSTAGLSEPQQDDVLLLPVAEEIPRATLRQAMEAVYDEMAGAMSRIKSRLSALRDQALKARAYGRHIAEPPDLRLAARVTVIGLSLFALLALYAAYDYVTSRPSLKPRAEKTGEVAEVSPLIPTPEEARNYKESEDQPTEEIEATGSSGGGRAIETPRPGATRQLLSNAERQSISNAEPKPKPTQAKEPQPIDTGPVPSQSTGGRINARLLRVRSAKANPGVRYDLTFVLHEEAGDAVRWERLVISTRSAKGLNQTQTIPFHHRQGASGSLTFTVSVQMFGPSEADLKGRVVCTTIGSDPSGRAMRASFGANVAP